MTDIQVDAGAPAPAPEPVAQPAPVQSPPAGVNEPQLAEEGDAAAHQDDQHTDSPESAPGVQEPRKQRRVQKRIDELTREKNDLKRMLEAAITGKQGQDATGQQQPAAMDAPPQIENFESYDEFVRAQARHEARQEYHAMQSAQMERQAVEARGKVIADFYSKATKLAERVPGIEDSVAAFVQGHIPISDAAAYNLVEVSECGPEVMHYLASNPREVERITRLDPIRQVRELTFIEQRLSPLEPKRVTSANPPPNIVQAKAETTKSPEDMSDDEYVEWARARKRK